MNNYDFYSGLFLMGLSGGTCIMAYRLGLGEIDNPGAGLIPFGTSVLLGMMSIGLSFKGLFSAIKGDQRKDVFKGITWGRVALVLCALLGYGIVFDLIGFFITTFLLMILLIGVVGRQKWWLTLTLSSLTAIGVYLIFVVWLDSSFPRGNLWQ